MNRVKWPQIFDLLFSVWCIVWFMIPVSLGPGVIGSSTNPDLLYPFMMAEYVYSLTPSFSAAVLFLLYFVPVYGFIRVVLSCIVIGRSKSNNILSRLNNPSGLVIQLFRIPISFIMIYALVLPILDWGDSESWFSAYPAIAYFSVVINLIASIISLYFLFQWLNNRNPAYLEYRKFSTTLKVSKTTDTSTRMESFFKIRTKLFIAFIGLIAIILILLSFFVLSRYRKTILDLVEDTAHTQAVQAGASYRVNLGDTIAMYEYLNRQVELNSKADFAYDDLSVYTCLKSELYIESLPKIMPDFKTEFSTRAPSQQFPELPPLAGTAGAQWLAEYRSSGIIPVQYDKQNRLFVFADPIKKIDTVRIDGERVKKERLIGFAVVTFKQDIVMRSYCKTRVTVLIFTLSFLYIAVVLTYIIGNYIVNPLLFLRMNVRKISDVLSGMINGSRRISSSQLQYDDYVTSRDEIHSLSTEIGDMVTVIRGIVPYISASTLKQAEKGIAATEKKKLTFLFTDIRGFTTLCEGLPPEEVVAILNHYLDLETEIILDNHGDVDKFVGDEMMAFFDGPDQEVNACTAAMEIRSAMMAEREKRRKEGKPIISIGIGINTGDVVFGSVGARDRMDFTSIGDTVNLAARLEGANKEYLSKSIITEAVYKKLQNFFICRELDFIAVKGKTEPVRIYELLQFSTQKNEKILQIKDNFEKGLLLYRKKEWKKAAELFQRNSELYEDGPSTVFLERANHFSRNSPPDNWDGVFRMTVK